MHAGSRDAGRRVGYREIFALAVPIMLSNASTPLIGFVDAAVVGQLGAPALIGGVAMASLIFNALYWVFGFLRMATTGFAAQAFGARDSLEITATALRALTLAVVIGATIVVFQKPILSVFLWFLGGSADVRAAASTYYDWRIWAAPAGLINFVLLGWFIGLGRTTTAFALQLGLNVANIALALLLALKLDQGVAGVGAAALIAEWAAALAGLVVLARALQRHGARPDRDRLLDTTKLGAMFAANRDILIRTACVLATAQVFMKMSAAQGDAALAANALLLNLLMIVYYLLDGYAHAAETLVGQAIGARDRPVLDDTVTKTFVVGALTAVLLGLGLWLVGARVIDMMTASAEVRALVAVYMPWAITLPIIAVWCFVYDGIFIGATRTVDMRNMMLLSFAAYLAALAAFVPWFANHGIWAAQAVFYIVRAITLHRVYPALAAVAGQR